MKAGRRGQGSATVQDVARLAGVSAMTVSRVVNGANSVRESTRQAVLAAIDRLQYRPNPAARSLAAGEATQIGLLYSNPSAAYLSQLLLGALGGARQSGCHLVLEPCDGESAEEQIAATRRFAGAGVRGVILPPPLSEALPIRAELDAEGIPWVAIALGCPGPGSHNVRIDDYQAALDMTRYLTGLGHRRIAFIQGMPAHTASLERYRGFIAGLEEAGLDPADMQVEPGQFTFRSGMAAAEHILARNPRPTALFASNDDMAAAAVGVAHRHGLHVPNDLSVVGFDDTPIATNIWPELTTIRQPIARMAEAAVAMLLARLRRGDSALGAMQEQVLPYSLITRGSSAPPPSIPA